MSARPYTPEEIAEFRETTETKQLIEAARNSIVLGHARRWLATLDAERVVSDRLREALKDLVACNPIDGGPLPPQDKWADAVRGASAALKEVEGAR